MAWRWRPRIDPECPWTIGAYDPEWVVDRWEVEPLYPVSALTALQAENARLREALTILSDPEKHSRAYAAEIARAALEAR